MEFKDSVKILVTGASGFIGSALCSKLSNLGRPFRGAIRNNGFAATVIKSIDYVIVNNINTYIKILMLLLYIICMYSLEYMKH